MTVLVLVVGYLSIDTVMAGHRQYDDVPGGAALYAALGARSVGARVELCAGIGEDYPPEWLDALQQGGIGIAHIQRHPGPTRRATLAHAASGARRSVYDRAWWARTMAHAPRPVPLKGVASVVACPMMLGCLNDWVEWARGSDTHIVADTSEAFAAASPADLLTLLQHIDAFAPSREETRLLLPGLDDDAAALALARHGPAVLQKRGPDGAVMATGGVLRRISAPPADRVYDPTGAGDATVGALAAGLAQGLPFAEAAPAALHAGARAVSGIGPQAFGFAPLGHVPA